MVKGRPEGVKRALLCAEAGNPGRAFVPERDIIGFCPIRFEVKSTVIRRFEVVAMWAFLAGAVGVNLAAQQPAPAAAPSPGQGAVQSSSDGEATQEILKSVHGYGSKVQFPAPQTPNGRYELKTGDSISVNFTLTSQYNESVIVRPDGYVGLIGAPDVHVGGDTLPEATEAIRKAYAGVLTDPLLTVTTKNFESPFFVVGGEVKNPGKFMLHGDTTVAQSIAIAGGFNGTTAKDSAALLLRRVSRDTVQARLIDLKGIDRGDISDDIHLQSGDMVFIPKNRLSKVQPFISYFLVYNVFNISFAPSGISAVGH